MGIVPQRVELGGDRLHGWEFRVGVAVLADQLPTHLGSIKPRVQAVGAKLRISLALRINNGRNIAEEIGQMCFRWLAPARGEVVQADQAAFQFTAAFPNRLTIPAKLAFGTPLLPVSVVAVSINNALSESVNSMVEPPAQVSLERMIHHVGWFNFFESLKGVSDYADLDKDDSYHKYAAEVSSMYILCFIKEYVTVDRMPRMHGVQQLPQSVVDESGEARKTRTSVLGMVKDGVQPNKALQPALLHKPFMTGDLSPEFVMRSIVHEQIVTAISDRPADTQPLHIIALTGAGGFGKTTLARQVCHDRRIRAMFPDGILWVTLDTGGEPS